MSVYQEKLNKKINNKNLTVGIIGLGYVGLPLALTFCESKIQVVGFDIDSDKIESIDDGKSYISHIENESISKNSLFLTATTDFSLIEKCNVIILCLPTPLDAHNNPDLTYITSTFDKIMPFIKKGQLLVLESTTYPGTTREEIVLPLLKADYEIGKDIFVCYSPEREDPGNIDYTTKNIPKVIAGASSNCLILGQKVYELAIDNLVPVSSLEVAEMSKLTENIQRAVNIGLMNELKVVADKMNIDMFEVIDAASTKPFGFTPYYPGPGLGGHCLPIDPFYLTYKAKEYGIDTQFIELAGKVNRSMPAWVVQKVTDALNDHGKAVKGSNILILGLAYKKNINDTRESPSIEILSLLKEKGALIEYSDPYIPTFPKLRNYSFDLKSLCLTDELLKSFDCIVLATDHDCFDFKNIFKQSRLIIDPRGKFRSFDNSKLLNSSGKNGEEITKF